MCSGRGVQLPKHNFIWSSPGESLPRSSFGLTGRVTRSIHQTLLSPHPTTLRCHTLRSTRSAYRASLLWSTGIRVLSEPARPRFQVGDQYDANTNEENSFFGCIKPKSIPVEDGKTGKESNLGHSRRDSRVGCLSLVDGYLSALSPKEVGRARYRGLFSIPPQVYLPKIAGGTVLTSVITLVLC